MHMTIVRYPDFQSRSETNFYNSVCSWNLTVKAQSIGLFVAKGRWLNLVVLLPAILAVLQSDLLYSFGNEIGR